MFGRTLLIINALITTCGAASSSSALRGLAVDDIGTQNSWHENLGECTGAICGLWGDPHIITCDGLSYDCQASGIFTLMKNHWYNIQGYFLSVGSTEMKALYNWGLFTKATTTNDIMIEVQDDSLPIFQFGFPDLSALDGTVSPPSEEGCFVGLHYVDFNDIYEFNMPGQSRSVEPSVSSCRERCETIDGCTQFTYFMDGGCHPQNDASYMLETPDHWTRSVSGPVDKCGLELARTETSTDFPFSRVVNHPPGYDLQGDEGGSGCPILFYVDGDLVDISQASVGGFLYGDATSDSSVQLESEHEIRVKHLTSTGSVSEAMLKVEGYGPGEMWGCHWAFWVCLPQDQQDLFASDTVGLFGSPDGNTHNDWMDVTNQPLPIPTEDYGRISYDYCLDNWCVSQDDSRMEYPPGTTYEDHKCSHEEYVPFDVNDDGCVISADKIIAKCVDMPNAMIVSCQMECCFGGCGTIDHQEDELEKLNKIGTDEEDLVYDPPALPTPMCDEDNKFSTGESVCPDSANIIEIVQKSSDALPLADQDLLYGIVLEGLKDDNIGRSIKFKVDNIFENEADIFVRYEKKVGQYTNEPMCESMPNTKSGCDISAPSIEVGCIEFGNGVEPFALVDLFFVSNEPTSFIKQNALPTQKVHKCCKAPDIYNNDDYGVVTYTLKIQCTCPTDNQAL